MQDFWKKLHLVGFKKHCTRNFNQDPVENFFACIRMQGVRNVNPTCTSFKNSLKTLIVNNFSSKNSPMANCEHDDIEVLWTPWRNSLRLTYKLIKKHCCSPLKRIQISKLLNSTQTWKFKYCRTSVVTLQKWYLEVYEFAKFVQVNWLHLNQHTLKITIN